MTDPDPIVITGMGAVSPLGVGVEANWGALMAGRIAGMRITCKCKCCIHKMHAAGPRWRAAAVHHDG